MVAAHDLDALHIALDDERGDPARVSSRLRHVGHDDHHPGDGPVGGPELDAVQHVSGPVLGRNGRGGEPGRVAADVRLGQEEGAHLPGGDARQPLPLLLLGAEQEQGADADALVGVDEHRHGGVVAADHLHDLAVALL